MSEEPEFDAKKFVKIYSSTDRFYQAVDIGPEALLRLRAEVLLDQYFPQLAPAEVEELCASPRSLRKSAILIWITWSDLTAFLRR
jgi:hypothetical protein